MTSASLAHALTQQLATGLGLPDPGPAWRDDLRRLALPESSAAELAESVTEHGRRCGLSFLRRSATAAELPALLRGSSAPFVLLADSASSGAAVSVVADALEDGVLSLRRMSSAGPGEVERVPVDQLTVRLGARGGIVAVLFPVRVLPETVRDAADAVPLSPLARMGELLYLERGNIGLVYAYATLVGLFSLTLPLGVQAIIGLVSGGLFLQPVALLIGFVVLGTALTGVLQVLQLSAVETIQQRIFARIALEFSLRVPRVSVEHALREDLPERMNRFFEVVTIQKGLGTLLTDTSTALLQVAFGLLLLTFYHPYFTLFGLTLVVTLALIVRVTGPRGLETSLMESKYKYRAVHWLEEVARAVATFKSAGRATPALDRMDEHVSGYLRYRQRHFRVLVTQAMAAIGFKTIVTGALLVLGSVLVIDRQITLGQFVAAELVIVTVLAGIEKLVASIADVYDVLTAVDKLGGVTDLPLERTAGLALPEGAAGLAVRASDLRYTYTVNDHVALSGLDFEVGPGERVAITGPDGSGETTLLSLIAGLLPGYEGNLLVGGITLRDLDLASLRDRMGLYLGSSDLFEGTVEENIALGRRGVGPAEVMFALDRVGAADAVQALPFGLQTPLPSGGRGLPSTLRIRLLIARAIVTRPRLLVLDECLATVEPKARRELVDALTGPGATWTLIAVSHAPDQLAACDRVLVLRDGARHAFAPWTTLAADPFVRALVPDSRSAA